MARLPTAILDYNCSIKGHSQAIRSANFSPDGLRIVTASDDQTTKIWDAKTGAVLATQKGHTGKVISASFSPDGTRILTASADGTAKIWDTRNTNIEVKTLKGQEWGVFSVSFSPDGSQFVTGGRPAKVWDANTGTEGQSLLGYTYIYGSAVFFPDGGIILAKPTGPFMGVWDSESGRRIAYPFFDEENITTAALSRDGTRNVTASMDKMAKVWDAQTGVFDPYSRRALEFDPCGGVQPRRLTHRHRKLGQDGESLEHGHG